MGQICWCSLFLYPDQTLFSRKEQNVRKLSVFVRENGFGVSADFWHFPGKLLKLL